MQTIVVGLGIVGILLALLGGGLFMYAIVKRTRDDSRGSLRYGSTEVNIPGPIVLCLVGIAAVVASAFLYAPSDSSDETNGSSLPSRLQPSATTAPTTSLPVTTFALQRSRPRSRVLQDE